MKNTYKRDGVWYSQFVSQTTGKTIKRKLSKSKVEAKKLLTNLMAEHAGVQNTSVQINTNNSMPIHVKQAKGASWNMAIKKWTDIHLSKYGDLQRNHMLAILERLHVFTGAKNVTDVTYGDVEDFLTAYVGKIKGTTINKYTRFINKFFNFCIKREFIGRNDNPCFGIELQEEEEYVPYHFTPEELGKLFAVEHTYTKFWKFMLETGMRACDAKYLTQSHFSVKSDGRMYLTYKSVKTRLTLDVPISIAAQEIVESLGDILFPETYAMQFKKSHNDQFLKMSLFTMRAMLGGKDHPAYDDLKHHTFRHTFAINHLIKYQKKEVLQSLLGHTSINTTEMFYANWIPKSHLAEYI
jgi:integrase